MRNSKLFAAVLGTAALFTFGGQSIAATLDFEGGVGTGYTPVDDAEITPDLFSNYGISITGPTAANPLSFEASNGGEDGSPPGANSLEGFVTDTISPLDYDTSVATDGSSLGDFFLRQRVGFDAAANPVFTINYIDGAPTSEVSGEIWDIDGTGANKSEQWRIDVLGSTGLLGSVTSPEGTKNDTTSLDGLPWLFVIDPNDYGDITALAFNFIGKKTSGIGVAFDNFETGAPLRVEPIPLPAALPLLLSALGFFGFIGWRRKKTAA